MRNLTWIPASCAALALVACHTGFQRRESLVRAASPAPLGATGTVPSATPVPSYRGVAAPTVVASRPAPVASAVPAQPVNATCPVMIGTPVDRSITSVWQGRLVAFADAGAKAVWDASPSSYASNLPRPSGSAGDVSPFLLPSTARLVAPASVPVPAPVAMAPTVTPSAAGTVPAPSPVPALVPLASHAAPAPAPALSSARILPPVSPAVVSPTAPASPAPRETHPATPSLPVTLDAGGSAADGSTGEACEDCPGGSCRLPGR